MSELFLPLILFALSMCLTPGPNNIMLTASGANFGFKRTLPHILGIEAGFISIIIISGLGLGILFERMPVVQALFKYSSAAYLLFMAWRIATAKRTKNGKIKTKPFSFLEAACFQLINPKTVLISISAISMFSVPGKQYYLSVLWVTLVFMIIYIPAASMWTGLGIFIGRYLANNTVHRGFNICMGILTAASVIQIIV